jgi:cyanophycinase
MLAALATALVLILLSVDALPRNGTQSKYRREPVDCIRRPTSEGGFAPLDPEDQFSSGLREGVSGSLVIAGGSLQQNSTVFQRILELAGGPDEARIVFFPTNGGGQYSTPEQREQSLNSFVNTAGWADLPIPVVLMHTYDPEEADTEEFWAPLTTATGVFFAGGLPYRAYDAYFGTGTQTALEGVLARGGVIGGSSAGALMQPNVMCRGDRSNDNSIVLGEPSEGFAFGGMQNIVVDVHWLMRNRGFDLVEVLNANPDLLGFSIDENTAIVMIGDEVEVVGTGWVGVYDTTLWQDENFCGNFNLYAPRVARPLVPSQGKVFFLGGEIRNGGPDRYNVRTREVILNTEMLEDWSIEEQEEL